MNILKINNISETPNISISGEEESKNLKMLEENGVTHILVAAEDLKKYFPKKFIYLTLPMKDIRTFCLRPHAIASVQFIEEMLAQSEKNHVLVHCKVGASRSVSMVICYLMLKWNRGFEEIYQYVKIKRPQTSPNLGFKLFMVEKWQEWVHKYYEVTGLGDSIDRGLDMDLVYFIFVD